MELFEKLLVGSHILAGALVLLSGLLAILVRKGKRLHILVGKIYFGGMVWIFMSAILMVSFVRFNLFLLVIGIFSFYMCFSGYRVLKRKEPGSQNWIDWTGAIISLLAGIGLIVFGIYIYFSRENASIIYVVFCILFGFFTLNSAREDIQFFLQPPKDDSMWWWYHHMNAMLGSYVAAITAFAVQSGNSLAPGWELGWLLWLLPAAIGVPLANKWVSKYKLKFREGIS